MSDQPLRILMVLRTPVGGLYRHVVDLTDALGERGHQVGLIMDSLTSDAQTHTRLEALKYPPSLGVHRTPMPRLFGFGDVTANLVVRKLARKLNAQVLHGHGAKGGFYARLARLGANRLVTFYTAHGGVLNFRPNAFSGKLMRWIDARLLALTDGVIFESHYTQTAYESQVSKVIALHRVVHNGLRADEFQALPPENAEYDFAYVGELRGLKGVSYLLEAAAELRRADGRPVSIILGGSGRDEQSLKQQAQHLDISDHVHFVGVRPAREVFAKGRCVVMPSLAESLPYVALEAAAATKPLIATDVGGVCEIFGPTADKLVPAGDSNALRDAMQAALDDPAAAQAEAEVRHAFVRDKFSVSRMADEIVATYREALAGR